MNPLCCIAPASIDREKSTTNVIGKSSTPAMLGLGFEVPAKNQNNVSYSRHSYSAQVSSISSSSAVLDQLHIGNHEAEDAAGMDSGGNGGWLSGPVAGILYKWVNYGKGWRPRWFLLENGVLSYYKLHGPDKIMMNPRRENGLRIIGDDSLKYVRKNSWGSSNGYDGGSYGGSYGGNVKLTSVSANSKQCKPFGEVHLKV